MKSDLKQYENDRAYCNCIEIARCWFNLIKDFSSTAKINDLKNDMKGKTLVCKFVGSNDNNAIIEH